MIQIRRNHDRGHANPGWLDTYHTFSFADYHDSRWMHFRSLRVINEDRVDPGQGFGTHPHRDMEILTVVLAGALEHKDSLGTGSIIRPGDMQRMTAGTGIEHSEFNPSETDPVHLIQIWILPERKGLKPEYEQCHFDWQTGRLQLLASRDGRDGSVLVHQDLSLFRGHLREGAEISYPLAPSRYAWIQVTSGAIHIQDLELQAGDGAAVSQEQSLEIGAGKEGTFLLFDLA